MHYKEKLKAIKTSVLNFPTKNEIVSLENQSSALANFDNELDELLESVSSSSINQMTVTNLGDVIRLIIVLDCSGSMSGTERDIIEGIKDIIKKHKHDNILINLVAFNGKTHVLLDDVFIGNAYVPEIVACGSTNLNDSLYVTMQAKCNEGVNLFVVISDGEDTENIVSPSLVRDTMYNLGSKHNHFYFLGEPNERQTPELVHELAMKLGFHEGSISIFTREGNGNRLNFAVISDMLEELLKFGTISSEWARPIKAHYLEYKR